MLGLRIYWALKAVNNLQMFALSDCLKAQCQQRNGLTSSGRDINEQ